MDRMSAMDAGFFFTEDENVPMHVGSLLVFDGPAPSYGDVVRLFAAKLGTVPRYRQRVKTLPLHAGWPVWVDDERFRISDHVRHTAVPSPGADDQLRHLAGHLFEQGLDLARPLWEVWLVDGLEGGRWAILCKVHHCLIDGIAGSDLMQVLLDWRADTPQPEPVEWRPAPTPSTADLVLDGVRGAVSAPVKQLAKFPAVARRLRSRSEVLALGRTVLDSLPTTARRLTAATPKSLNGPVGPHRRWVWAKANVAEIKAVRVVTGGTVNDVVLAAVTRGFRDLLAKRDELAEGQVVRSMVPVSTRSSAERGVLNNRFSAVLVNLPVSEADPLARLASIREQMDGLKRSGQAAGADVLVGLSNFAAPSLLALGSRMAKHFPQQLVQTLTTNIPGPRVPLFMVGRRLTETYPYVPISGNMRISVGIFSYLDQITFGISADLDSVPDVQVLSDGIRAGFDELATATS
ncbi:WS/DGAT/MGAT family O-acyltransferase [Saccharothrix isguenensis]